MTICFFSLSILFFIIGLIQFIAPEPTIVEKSLPRQRSMPPTAVRQSSPRLFSTPSPRVESSSGGVVLGNLQKFAWIKVGQRIYVPHPVKGELMAHVEGRIIFAELWQRTRGPQSPWVPTGNIFAGFWLERELLLLNWQNRFYLLEERIELSDVDVQRDFLPHARKFAQSDQTADVYFAYPPAMWHIDDIGKFRVEQIDGIPVKYQQGGIGRFIHASGDGQRALVVEDFEGGVGQDMVWIGFQIDENEVKSA